jgi:hypothetical protein
MLLLSSYRVKTFDNTCRLSPSHDSSTNSFNSHIHTKNTRTFGINIPLRSTGSKTMNSTRNLLGKPFTFGFSAIKTSPAPETGSKPGLYIPIEQKSRVQSPQKPLPSLFAASLPI